jgi:hypothetical protein
MANEIYHRTNWGEAKPEGFGDMYFDPSATNKLYNRSTYYENSDATDKILANIPNKASIVFTATGYSQDKIGSAIPVDANGDFDFHRESTATRVNEAGLIEASQGNDTPRIDFTNGEGAFLIEPQMTNTFQYSEDFSQGNWGKNSLTVTSNNIVSPDGTVNASLLTITGSISYLSQVQSLNSGDTFTISAFVKKGTNRWVRLAYASSSVSGAWFDLENIAVGTQSANSVSASIENYGNGWYRIKNTITSHTSTGLTFIALSNSDGNGSDAVNDKTIYVWGLQVEESSFATSYIPTNASTVTRVGERVNSSGNSDLFNDSEGVLYAEIASLAESVGNNKKFSISSGASSNSVFFSFRGTNNQIQVLVKSGGTNTVNVTPTISPAVTNFFKIAIKYKTDDFALFVNGTKVATDTSCIMPTGLNTLNFDRGDGGQDYIGKVKCIAVFKEALTDAELTQLTS